MATSTPTVTARDTSVPGVAAGVGSGGFAYPARYTATYGGAAAASAAAVSDPATSSAGVSA